MHFFASITSNHPSLTMAESSGGRDGGNSNDAPVAGVETPLNRLDTKQPGLSTVHSPPLLQQPPTQQSLRATSIGTFASTSNSTTRALCLDVSAVQRLNLPFIDPSRWGWTAAGGIADLLTPHEVGKTDLLETRSGLYSSHLSSVLQHPYLPCHH